MSLKRIIEPELARPEELMLFHKPQDSNQDFSNYISKAAYYRDILTRINQALADLNT